MNKQTMEVQQFLSGAYLIDRCIEGKVEQIQELSDLVTRATSALSDMPGNKSRNISRMEDIIVRIIDLQAEIGDEINKLLLRKKQIQDCINQVDNIEGRMVLEKRYLMNYKWESIADECDRGLRQVFRIHETSLKNITIPESCQ